MSTKNTELQGVYEHFRRVDPALFAVLKTMEFEALTPKTDPKEYFQHLCREIIYQQLAGKAAHAIHSRFAGLFPQQRVTPKNVLKKSAQDLRDIGLSWAKARYVLDLAQKTADKTVALDRLHTLENEAAVAELTKVKGIGRWTAEMFLMFTLGREDVFSNGDLGLRKGLEKVYGKAKTKTPRHIEKIVGTWNPYRTYGCLALWHAVDTK